VICVGLERKRWRAGHLLCMIRSFMLWLVLALASGLALAMPCAALAAPLELAWDAPDACPDREAVEALVSQRLGERSTPRAAPLTASGRISTGPTGFALTLRTPTGERKLEAASCDELAQSAAVILALLIDPRAAPVPPPSVEPEPEPEPEPDPEPAEESSPTSAPNSASRMVHGFVRAELVGDVGLLPSVGLGPGVAGGVVVDRTTLELSGTYLPAHDVTQGDDDDVGDLRAFIGRLGACQALLAKPALGPCAFVEYTRLLGGGDDSLEPHHDVDGGLWSLLAAARLSVGIDASFGWILELGVGLPLSIAEFSVGEGASARTVHRTSRVVGHARTGLELRF
jgi:hypothetical protein